MTSTTYASASGLDDVHNLSTALDQALLARAALRNPIVRRHGLDEDALDEMGRADVRQALGQPQPDARRRRPGTYGVKTGLDDAGPGAA